MLKNRQKHVKTLKPTKFVQPHIHLATERGIACNLRQSFQFCFSIF